MIEAVVQKKGKNDMLIEMKVKNLAFDLSKSGAMVFLEEINGKRVLPIWIGIFEANAIALELRKISTARPMTHDLILNIIKGLEAEATKIVVTELKDNTFYAIINIINQENRLVRIDSRPSDAIATAVRSNCDIYVEEKVLDSGGLVIQSIDEEVNKFRDFLDHIEPDDFKDKK